MTQASLTIFNKLFFGCKNMGLLNILESNEPAGILEIEDTAYPVLEIKKLAPILFSVRQRNSTTLPTYTILVDTAAQTAVVREVISPNGEITVLGTEARLEETTRVFNSLRMFFRKGYRLKESEGRKENGETSL